VVDCPGFSVILILNHKRKPLNLKKMKLQKEYALVKENLLDWKPEFDKLEKRGFIRTTASGDLAVGHTLESQFGVEPNSVPKPDLGNVEVKGARKSSSSSKQTLFCLESWVIDQREYLEKYGWVNRKGTKFSAMQTINTNINKHGFFLSIDSSYVSIVSEEDVIWQCGLEEIQERFNQKFPACLKVFADSYGKGWEEYFHYNEVILYKNVDRDRFLKLLQEGHISIEIRLETKNDWFTLNNYGTAFRISHDKMNLLFEKEAIWA